MKIPFFLQPYNITECLTGSKKEYHINLTVRCFPIEEQAMCLHGPLSCKQRYYRNTAHLTVASLSYSLAEKLQLVEATRPHLDNVMSANGDP